MTNNFSRRDYRDPSEPQSMVAGLKAAQSELSGVSVAKVKEEAEEDEQRELWGENRAQGKSIGELLRLQLDEYAGKIKNERSRLERTKTCLEESQKKISERLAKIDQVAGEIERVKRNIEVIEGELSSAQNQNTDILEQMKDKLNQLKDSNE